MIIQPITSPDRIGMGFIKLNHQTAYDNFVFNARLEFAKLNMYLSGGTAIDQNDLVHSLGPDIVAFTLDLIGVFVIEITRSRNLNAMFLKGLEYIDRYPDVQEYFVFDFEKQVLYAPNEDMSEWFASTDHLIYSEFLSKPLVEYFRYPDNLLPLYRNIRWR
ncbi:MAG: hypothetical protein IJU35_04255 [Paludibacteraceae bacterium]|nr:hypothetical protein [Paludibacteraceae bacterium]